MHAGSFMATVVSLALAPACAHTASSAPPSGVERAVVRLVEDQYRAIERGDLDAWAAAYAPSAMLFGTDPSETYLGRDAIIDKVVKAAAGRMRPNIQRTYRTTGKRKIGIAPDQKSAWIGDEIEYTLTSSASTKRHVFRLTELAAEENGRWSILGAHYSVAVPDARASSVSWATPRAVPDLVGPGAEAIAAVLGTMDQHPSHFAGAFSSRPDVFLYGTAPEERVFGGTEVQRFTRQGDDSGTARVRRIGGAASGIAASGTAGWLAYTATLTVAAGGRTVDLPVRVFAVFLKEGDTWTKVQEHVSLPVPD